QPWRSSDLLVIKVNGSKTLPFESEEKKEIKSFSRPNNSSVFRIFLEKNDINSCFPISTVKDFSGSISQRDKVDQINLWTSDKKGFQVDDTTFFNDVLQLWSIGHNKNETIKIISSRNSFNETEIELFGLMDLENSLIKLSFSR
ncbi:TPA: hypothetical protein RUZ40_003764, partial [Vibrio cholerae]|nr:hypothetical protein [Vibrio cholerae]